MGSFFVAAAQQDGSAHAPSGGTSKQQIKEEVAAAAVGSTSRLVACVLKCLRLYLGEIPANVDKQEDTESGAEVPEIILKALLRRPFLRATKKRFLV